MIFLGRGDDIVGKLSLYIWELIDRLFMKSMEKFINRIFLDVKLIKIRKYTIQEYEMNKKIK